MSALGLESLAPCFQGLIPATLYTCSADGIPNAAYLSHVDYVDAAHVALSFQFFNKSRRNVAENPNALVRVVDPDTQQGWELRLRYEHSEATGPIFERMALRLEAIASYCGMKGIFKLLAADIYQVLSVTKVPEQPGSEAPAGGARRAPDAVFTMQALQHLAVRLHSAGDLDSGTRLDPRRPGRILRLPSLDDPRARRTPADAGGVGHARLPGAGRRRRGQVR